MAEFNINILGCGSALPTTRHLATSQVVDLRDKLYMIDCGEGTQVQMRRMRLHFGRLAHIFISHLHGDHCFGLPGLISTLGMLGRTGELVVHGPKEVETYLRPICGISVSATAKTSPTCTRSPLLMAALATIATVFPSSTKFFAITVSAQPRSGADFRYKKSPYGPSELLSATFTPYISPDHGDQLARHRRQYALSLSRHPH